MARSTNIYVVVDEPDSDTTNIVGAFTVKHELVTW